MSNSVPTGTLVGPWREAFWLAIEVPARSKSNYRRSRSRSDDWAVLRAFELVLYREIRRAVPAGWDLGPSQGPVKKRPPVVAFMAARAILDAGNLSKSVLDAPEGVVYHTDASVAFCAQQVVRATENQWVEIAFARLDVGASPQDILTAGVALATGWGAARMAALGSGEFGATQAHQVA